MAHKVACLMVMCMIVVAATPHAEALISCGQVQSAALKCLSYLKNGGVVPGPCCIGVKGLNTAAKTTTDRRAVCQCLQDAAKMITGINFGYAAALPGKCGVNIPYKISPSTDCSKVR